MKINFSIDDELLARVESFAQNNYMSRSGFITQACIQYLNVVEVQFAVRDLAISMRKIADTGKIDDEARTHLEDFERIAKMVTGGKI